MIGSLIKRGDDSPEVADVQVRLRGLGYVIDDYNGHFDSSTYQAVRAFQQSRKILVDGIVGPHTWRELVEASWRLGDRNLYVKLPPMRGDDVLALQHQLSALGFDSGRADGIFGADTASAVRAFQREYAVAEDAIFGPITHSALLGLRVNRPGTAAGLREELRHSKGTGVVHDTVVIDPGHGPGDPGSIGPSGLEEADVCWELATALERELKARGATVHLSRSAADSPGLAERAHLANELGADIFLSIHLNSHPSQEAQGCSSYYFGGSLRGEALADEILKELVQLGLSNCRSHARSYPQLKETRMPAVLIEPAFISSEHDEKLLADHAFRDQIAAAIANGVQRANQE